MINHLLIYISYVICFQTKTEVSLVLFPYFLKKKNSGIIKQIQKS